MQTHVLLTKQKENYWGSSPWATFLAQALSKALWSSFFVFFTLHPLLFGGGKQSPPPPQYYKEQIINNCMPKHDNMLNITQNSPIPHFQNNSKLTHLLMFIGFFLLENRKTHVVLNLPHMSKWQKHQTHIK